MSHGTCALCLNLGELRDSHIISNAYFRQMKRENAGKAVAFDDASNSLVRYSIESWSEYLLCATCEGKFSTYETYGVEALRRTANAMNDNRIDGGNLVGFNFPRLNAFLVSILWRAAVSRLDQFSKVVLTPSLLEDARASLYLGNPLRPNKLGCRIIKLVDATRVFSSSALEQIIASPQPRIRGRYISYIFVMGGYVLEYFVPNIPMKESCKLGVVKNSRILFIPHVDVCDVKELFALLVAGCHKAHTGKVAFESSRKMR